VTSVYEIDMTNVAKFRDQNKGEFQSRYGTKLTYMPFIFQAVNNAIRKFPIVNAQVDGENIVYKGDINLGNGSSARLGIDRSGDQEGRHAFAVGTRARGE
jgi:2-oxoglutarate dehydrogenase E2 component (dihydrolipoamide succinyltransferase)